MIFNPFRRSEGKPLPTREELIRNAVNFIVENGFLVAHGSLFSMDEYRPLGGMKTEQRIREAVKATLESFRDESLSYVNRKMAEVNERLMVESLVDSITEELVEAAVDAARGRALVKGFRAGLEHSEAYRKLMEARTVKEVEHIEGWIERSEAYKAISAG